MIVRTLALAAALPALASCAQIEQPDRAVADVPVGNVTGEAVSCIDTRSIRSTKVHGDETIDFEMAGDRIYRNVLPSRCYSLGFEQRFGYQTTTGQLCRNDSITVLHSDGARGTTCMLGEFLPIQLETE